MRNNLNNFLSNITKTCTKFFLRNSFYLSIIEKFFGKSFSISFINSDGFMFKASASLKTVVSYGSFIARSIVLIIETEISFSLAKIN